MTFHVLTSLFIVLGCASGRGALHVAGRFLDRR
jgi:hypothetical protein